MTLLLALLGGFFYRCRGGLLDDLLHKELPNTLIRMIWALYITLLIGNFNLSLGVFLCALLGVVPSYWGGKFDLSKLENRNWRNYAWLTARGAFICLPLALFLSLFGMYQAWLGVAAGSGFVLYYLLGIEIYKFCKLQGHTQWGEWLLGISIGLSLAGVSW